MAIRALAAMHLDAAASRSQPYPNLYAQAVQSSKQALWRQRLVALESQLAAKLNGIATTALRKQVRWRRTWPHSATLPGICCWFEFIT